MRWKGAREMSEITVEKAIENLQGMKDARYATISENMGELYEKIVLDDLDSLDMALTALDQLRWRDADKELPEELTAVLVYGHCDNKLKRGMDVCWICHGRWTSWFVNDITHWLPLPTPPEVKK
jgi:hypothetical protein